MSRIRVGLVNSSAQVRDPGEGEGTGGKEWRLAGSLSGHLRALYSKNTLGGAPMTHRCVSTALLTTTTSGHLALLRQLRLLLQ